MTNNDSSSIDKKSINEQVLSAINSVPEDDEEKLTI